MYHYLTGEKYTGEWINGHRDGKGTFVFSTGDSYKGIFK